MHLSGLGQINEIDSTNEQGEIKRNRKDFQTCTRWRVQVCVQQKWRHRFPKVLDVNSNGQYDWWKVRKTQNWILRSGGQYNLEDGGTSKYN